MKYLFHYISYLFGGKKTESYFHLIEDVSILQLPGKNLKRMVPDIFDNFQLFQLIWKHAPMLYKTNNETGHESLLIS